LAAGVIAAAVATTVRVTVQCDYGFFGTGLLCTSSDKGRPPQAAGILVNRHLVFSDAVAKAVSFDFSEDMFEEEFGFRKLTVQGTVGTHKHRHPPAPCEQGFLPENIACLSV
jgi:hypothetical protein